MRTAKQKADLESTIVEHDLSDVEADALRTFVGDGSPVAEALAVNLPGREEAGAIEPDESAGEPTATGDPTPKQLRALDAEVARHLGEVQTIMGAHVAGMPPCEWCGGVGLMPSTAPKPHDNFRRCDTCNGHGEVLTGSSREGYQSRQCPTCKGRGYLEKLDASGAPVSPDGPPMQNETSPTAPPVAPPPTPVTAGAVNGDGFGVPSWMGDPHAGG